MPELKIDYSGLVEAPSTVKSSWRPPRHVFFGKRNPEDGTMEEEPVYVHQEYPRLIYKLDGDVIKARLVHSDAERDPLLADGWAKTPADFGYIGAPSFEEVVKMREAAKAKAAESVSAEPAAPKKWANMNAEERAAYKAEKDAKAA
jgi:hypothetical protein